MSNQAKYVLISNERTEHTFMAWEDVYVYINESSCVPVKAMFLDDDKTPFQISLTSEVKCTTIIKVITK